MSVTDDAVTCIRADLVRHGLSPTFGRLVWGLMSRPGFLATFLLRLQIVFVYKNRMHAAALIRVACVTLTGSDFVPGCSFGPGLLIHHPVGIVVGAGVRGGRNVTLLQNVTLGEANAD